MQETGAPPRQEASKPPFSLFILLGIPPPCCPEQTRCHRSLQVNVTTSPSYFLPRVSALGISGDFPHIPPRQNPKYI